MPNNKHPHEHVHTSFIKSTRPTPDATPPPRKRKYKMVESGNGIGHERSGGGGDVENWEKKESDHRSPVSRRHAGKW
jgi:hypothetical protein